MTGTTPASAPSLLAGSPLRHGHDKSALQTFMTDNDLAGAPACTALHDSLTLLPNQAYFRDKLERALLSSAACGQTLVALYLDLDGFKFVNDSRDYAVGDELLRIVAVRINQAVRMDDMMCRLGGDEFACLLGGPASRAQLSQLACKISACKQAMRSRIGSAANHGPPPSSNQRLDHCGSQQPAPWCVPHQRTARYKRYQKQGARPAHRRRAHHGL
jgi:diguanylate cyclase (GGDEF)-like protein